MPVRAPAAAIAVALFLIGTRECAAEADLTPQGLYFHTFTGSVTGSEWSTWGPRPGVNRYEFSDLTSSGTYPGTITPTGAITLAAGQGTGTFHDQDSATINFTLSGGLTFHSEITRAPFTDARFPVFFTGAIAGDDTISGTWRAVVQDIDPATGATLEERSEPVDVSSTGSILRVTLADGTFFQGVWVASDQASFRVIEPNARLPRYRTIPGCETSASQDLVGEVRIIDESTMTATLALQTRAPLGSQTQSMTHITLTRVPAPGASIPVLVALLVPRRRRSISQGNQP